MQISIVLFGNPRSKKNSMQVGRNKFTGNTFVSQSKVYKEFEKDCLLQLREDFELYKQEPINQPVNIKCVYYREDNKRCDLPNLINATLDILVKGQVIADDNFKIVASLDGSKVLVDKFNPRTEILITEL